MFDLYPTYKPFRNFMSGFAAQPALITLWGYYSHIVSHEPLLPGLAMGRPQFVPLTKHIYPWDLEILVREVILNGASNGHRDLARWGDLAAAVNHIRRLEDAPYEQRDTAPDVMLDLHRMAHRQFRWQSGNIDAATLIRLLKIFGDNALDSRLQSSTGLGIKQLLRLGMVISGGLSKRWNLTTDTDYSPVGIDHDASSELLSRLTSDLSALRVETRDKQRYDETWLYTWSHLEARPLIRLQNGLATQVMCPVPRYLFARLTTGVFYDIVNANGFANPYGGSFQRYVGEVISTTLSSSDFKVLEEEPYAQIKAKLKHGTDWIVSDTTGHLFLECKTKRMSVGSKNLTDPHSIDVDMTAMAKAIAQNYKNIGDAQKGLTKWVPDGLPMYPVIVTLEDWHLHSPRLVTQLKDQIKTMLIADAIDPSLVETLPYTIAAVSELEQVLQVIAKRGIHPVFGQKVTATLNTWALSTYVQQHFHDELAQGRHLLFPDDAQRLLPEFNINPDT